MQEPPSWRGGSVAYMLFRELILIVCFAIVGLPVTQEDAVDQGCNVIDVDGAARIAVAVGLLDVEASEWVAEDLVDEHGNVINIDATAVVDITQFPIPGEPSDDDEFLFFL